VGRKFVENLRFVSYGAYWSHYRGAAMSKLGGWWCRGGFASLALTAWVTSESFCEAQSLRPGQSSQSGPAQSGQPPISIRPAPVPVNRTSPGGYGISPYVTNNNAGLGNLGGSYNVPNYSRTSYIVPGVGPVTVGYNPNYPVNNLPYGPYSPYQSPYGPYSQYPSPYGPYAPYQPPYAPAYNPYFNPYMAQYSYPGSAPFMGPYGPYAGSGFGNQFNPYGIFPPGSYSPGFGAYDPFGPAFGGGLGGGANGFGYGPRF
jgi:hypothetical protein